ncbi:MAG: type II toxin-antitoxin system HicB family antitoxin [Deltaproteobacteria bacterium]|nr:type II toxin-antitoxin system HicB family antitoxin [Deltaproteobacteria bacterium]
MGEKIFSIRFSMHLPAILVKKEKWYVANCPVLDISSQGKTEDDAKKNLSEAIASFMISCHERGTLDAVLKNCGFVPDYSTPPISPMVEDTDYIDVPLPFIIDMGNPNRCHA